MHQESERGGEDSILVDSIPLCVYGFPPGGAFELHRSGVAKPGVDGGELHHDGRGNKLFHSSGPEEVDWESLVWVVLDGSGARSAPFFHVHTCSVFRRLQVNK